VCPQKQSGSFNALREAAPYLGLGLEMAVTLLAALGAGYWVDGKLGTRPAFMFVGGILGIGLALYSFVKTVGGGRQ
jgi:F0F1-type ATP synthase assembly protein I